MNPTPLADQSPQLDPWATPPDDFRFVLFERIDVGQNEQRYYLVAWQPTLFGWGVVRIWGRKGETQNLRADPFSTLDEAWPVIRGHIRARSTIKRAKPSKPGSRCGLKLTTTDCL